MPVDSLHHCLRHIANGPWSFIQLRGKPLSEDDIDDDDVDLLGSEASVHALLDAAYEWARRRLCHVLISARSPRKKCLVLYSIDGRHRVTFDLWIELPQLVGTNRVAHFEDFEAILASADSSIRRLPIDIEAALYLHHLAAKKKDVTAESAHARLASYIDACKGHRDILSGLKSALQNSCVDDEVLTHTLGYLLSKMALMQKGARTLRYRPLLKATSRGHFLTIMGCDGVGKTSLSESMAGEFSPEAKLFKGKHLYRKSIVYKLAVIFIRPFLLQSREKFDETFAPFVYVRASLGLRLKQFFHKGTLLIIDRSVTDFLYLDRKTDHPRFSSCKWLTGIFGCRVPTVHCIASYETIAKRKPEMTEKGSCLYDQDMFRHFSRRMPTEYLLFNNDDTLEAGRDAMLAIIRDVPFPLASQYKTGEDSL